MRLNFVSFTREMKKFCDHDFIEKFKFRNLVAFLVSIALRVPLLFRPHLSCDFGATPFRPRLCFVQISYVICFVSTAM